MKIEWFFKGQKKYRMEEIEEKYIYRINIYI